MIKRKIRRSLVWITVICFSFCVQSGFAQSIQTYIDKKDILIGEPISYHLQFTLPSADFKIDFNIPDSFQHFEIMDKFKSDSTDKKGSYLVLQNIKLTSWDSGQWAIPSFPIKIRNAATNQSYTLNTDQVLINVGYAPADSTGELRDIKPVMEVFYIDRSWIYIAAGAVVLLILLILLYRYFKKRPKKEKPLFDSKLTAYEEAIQGLQSLRSTSLNDEPSIKNYHTSLSDIFKKYYSRKKRKNLLNKTTGDILLELKGDGLDSNTMSTLAEALRASDAVKFAKYIPPAYESEQSLDKIRATIEGIEKAQPIQNNL